MPLSLPDRIRMERLKRGLSQQDLAENTRYSLQSVCNWENGRHRPEKRAIRALEEFFGVKFETEGGERTK